VRVRLFFDLSYSSSVIDTFLKQVDFFFPTLVLCKSNSVDRLGDLKSLFSVAECKVIEKSKKNP
jgi:hypothetical protein